MLLLKIIFWLFMLVALALVGAVLVILWAIFDEWWQARRTAHGPPGRRGLR